MKKLFLFLTILLISGVGLFAQTTNSTTPEETSSKREKMMKEVQEFKMKYLAQEMDLSEVQKKKFFELYEEMSQAKQSCYKEAIQMDRELKQDKDASEEDYQQVTVAFNKANQEWSEEEKVYNEKFAEFLTQKQIYKMREAENNFRAKLDEMKHSRRKDHHKKKDSKK